MDACPKTQANIRNYLDDLLSEDDRGGIRAHLDYCRECGDYIARQAHWSNDLKMITRTGLPFDLPEAIKAAMLRPHEKKKAGKRPWLRIFLAGYAVISTVFFAQHLAKNSGPKPAVTAAPAAPSLAPQNPAPAAQEKARPKIAVNLHPVRWDLVFSGRKDRENFFAELKNKSWDKEYQTDEAVVVSLDRPQLVSLAALIAEKIAPRPKGVFASEEEVPFFEGKVRVTMLLRTSGPNPPGIRFMQLKFQLPNIFVLQEQLESQKIAFLYDSPQLWVLQAPGAALDELKMTIRSTPGAILTEDPEPSGAGKAEDLKIFLSIDMV